ncbi:MAG: hypothetical protein VX278_06340 [Myxococcota bacterium]|nr:hypothetical protein [Myxococcota bacterium]
MFDENRINALLRGEKVAKKKSVPEAPSSVQRPLKKKPIKSRRAPEREKRTTDIELAEWSSRYAKQEEERIELGKQVKEMQLLMEKEKQNWEKKERELNAQIESYRSKWKSISDSYVSLNKQYTELQEQNTQLKDQLSNPALPKDMVPLRDLFQERGLRNEVECNQALRACSERAEFPLTSLWTSEGAKVRSLLEKKLLLLDSSAPKEAILDRSPIEVSGSRCEITGGTDLNRSLRVFKDVMLMNGITKAAVFGGDAQDQEIMRPLLFHHALQIAILPSVNNFSVEERTAIFEKNQLVLVWGDVSSPLHHECMFISQAGTLGVFLKEASEHFLKVL